MVVALSATAAPALSGCGEDDPAPQETLSAHEADTLAADLISGKPDRVSDALVLPDGQSVDPYVAFSLGSFKSIDIDEGTFEASEPDLGTVEATAVTARRKRQSWDLLLQLNDGEWKIVGSTPSEES